MPVKSFCSRSNDIKMELKAYKKYKYMMICLCIEAIYSNLLREKKAFKVTKLKH